jgi:lipopolysaccharide biosynthesis glycosyltransferase/nitroreductase
MTAFVSMIDDNFFKGFEGFFKSLLLHNPDFDYPFYFLDNGLSPVTKGKMKKIYPNIHFIPIRKGIYNFSSESTIPELLSTYYKLECFDSSIFPSEVDRIIFMDMDILILGDILPLVDFDLKGKPFGACKQYKRGGDSLVDDINSGVFIVDFPLLPNYCFETLLQMIEQGGYLPDQIILNDYFVSSGQCTYLPKIYNIEKRMIESTLKFFYNSAVCLHFISTKPWQEQSKKEEVYLPAYKKWWDLMEDKKSLKRVDPPIKVPVSYRRENTIVLYNKESIEGEYDCIFLSCDFSFDLNYLYTLYNNNLNRKGFICGDGFSYKKTSNSGKVLMMFQKKPDFHNNDFWLFYNKEVKSYNKKKVIEPTPDSEFKDLLNGKRVIFVGPSPILKGKKRGKEIDSYDIVVRTNNMLNTLDLSPELEEDYGKRCDVLYVNITYERDSFSSWDVDNWVKRGLKFIKKKGSQTLKEDIPVKWSVIKHNLPPEKGSSFLIGLLLIYDILQYNIKSLYVTGIDAYEKLPKLFEKNKSLEYVENYLPKFNISRRNNLVGFPSISRHNVKRDSEIMLNLETDYSNTFSIDPICRNKIQISKEIEETRKMLAPEFRKNLHILEKRMQEESPESYQPLLSKAILEYENIQTSLSEEEKEYVESILYNRDLTTNIPEFTIPSIAQRRSVRLWKKDKIKVKDLNQILNSGLYAPSSCNRQPIEYIVIEKKNVKEKIASLKGQSFFKHADKIVVVLVNQDSYKKDKLYFSCLDAGACIQNMLLTIDSLGLGGCWVNSSKEEKGYEEIKEFLLIPDEFIIASFVAIGVPEKQPKIPVRKGLTWKVDFYV